jgi:hypothetical protein
MNARVKILFKINNEVVVEESTDLFLNQIDEMKWIIASECECSYDDIEVERIELPIDISDEVDVSVDGMHFWKALDLMPIQGVYATLEEGSDEYLDAILDGSIEKHLNFFV